MLLVMTLMVKIGFAQCTPRAISGPTSVYVGSVDTFSNSITGGTWSISNPGVATIDATSGALTAITQGAVTVTYNMPGACMLFYSTLDIRVNNSINTPSVMVGDSVVPNLLVPATVVTWSSADTSFFKVTSTGRIIGKRLGASTINVAFNSRTGIRCMESAPVYIQSNFGIHSTILLGSTDTVISYVPGGTYSLSDTNSAIMSSASGIMTTKAIGSYNVYCQRNIGGVNCVTSNNQRVVSQISFRTTVAAGTFDTARAAFGSGNWSSSDTMVAKIEATTGILSALRSGQTTIVYNFNRNGRSYIDSARLTVRSQVSMRGSLCVGYTDTARAIYSSGVWHSTDSSIATIDSVTGVINARRGGNVVIIYSVNVAGHPFFDSSHLVVVASPSVPHYSDVVTCSSWSASIHDINYTWSSSNPTLTYFIGSVAGANNGTGHIDSTTIRYYYNACPVFRDSFKVKLKYPAAPPAISATHDAICFGDSIQFSVVGYTGGWSASTRLCGSIDTTGIFRYTTAIFSTGIISITFSAVDSQGCAISSSRSFIARPVVVAGSIVGVSNLNIGIYGNYRDSARLNDTAGIWSLTSSIATVSSTGTLTALDTGVVTLTYTARGICNDAIATKTIHILPPLTGGMTPYFVGYTRNVCGSTEIGANIYPHTAPFRLITSYGDGNSDTTGVDSSGIIVAHVLSHFYTENGTYSIVQALYRDTTLLGALHYSYNHLTCNGVRIRLFNDANHDGLYEDSVDRLNALGIQIEIDSNGVAIDTVPVTSGIYFNEFGRVGDVYTYKIINSVLTFTSTSSNQFKDTILAGRSISKIINQAVVCSGSGTDLYVTRGQHTGRHRLQYEIGVGNNDCTPKSGVLQLRFDSRYDSIQTSIRPTSSAAGLVSWALSDLSNIGGMHPTISFVGEARTWITPGTPIEYFVRIIPDSAIDIDTFNNWNHGWDTVKSSWDPNSIQVSPAGAIHDGTKLTYSITFENDGNDTAFNIFVMDTIPNELDINTIHILSSSADMNTSIIKRGGYQIIKFDFPNINLPDSSDHLHCHGMLSYTIQARRGLPDGRTFSNHAGIYFDINPVVMTDTAFSTIVYPHVAVDGRYHDSICIPGANVFTATSTHTSNHHYTWYQNGTVVGSDSNALVLTAVLVGDSIWCMMSDIQQDTVVVYSNHIITTWIPTPSTGTITGVDTVCNNSLVHFTETIAGGEWRTLHGYGTADASGTFHFTNPGEDSILYIVRNQCTAVRANAFVYIRPQVTPAVNYNVMTSRRNCENDSAILVAVPVNPGSHPAYKWYNYSTFIGSGDSLHVSLPMANYYSLQMASDAICRSLDTVISTARTTAVGVEVTPTINIESVPADTMAAYLGQAYTFYATATYGGSSPVYQWFINGVQVAGATGFSFVHNVSTNDTVSCRLISDVPCALEDSVSSNTIRLYSAVTSVNKVQQRVQCSVAPNPSHGDVVLSGDFNPSAKVTVRINDVAGREVYTSEYDLAQNVHDLPLHISSVAPGTYYLKLQNGAIVEVIKLVIE